jgi:hypothetical protein
VKQDYLENRQFSFITLFPWVWILSFVSTCALYATRVVPVTSQYPMATLVMVGLLVLLWAVFYSLWKGNAGAVQCLPRSINHPSINQSIKNLLRTCPACCVQSHPQDLPPPPVKAAAALCRCLFVRVCMCRLSGPQGDTGQCPGCFRGAPHAAVSSERGSLTMCCCSVIPVHPSHWPDGCGVRSTFVFTHAPLGGAKAFC